MKKILILILAITSNPVFSDDTFGDWEVGLAKDKTSHFAWSSLPDGDVSLIFYFKSSKDCNTSVSAQIHSNTSGDAKSESKDKPMKLTTDKGYTWSVDRILVKKSRNYIDVTVNFSDENLIAAVKKGNKLKVKIGELPIYEFSLDGSSKALTEAEKNCRIVVAKEDLLK